MDVGPTYLVVDKLFGSGFLGFSAAGMALCQTLSTKPKCYQIHMFLQGVSWFLIHHHCKYVVMVCSEKIAKPSKALGITLGFFLVNSILCHRIVEKCWGNVKPSLVLELVVICFISSKPLVCKTCHIAAAYYKCSKCCLARYRMGSVTIWIIHKRSQAEKGCRLINVEYLIFAI